jgi:O-antigen ligase
MSADAATSSVGPGLPVWRDPLAWAKTAEIFAVRIALPLPWSTSLVGIFAVTVAPTLDTNVFLEPLKLPFCALPIALFARARFGTLWLEAPCAGGYTLSAPPLSCGWCRYRRSSRGMWVFGAFLFSYTLHGDVVDCRVRSSACSQDRNFLRNSPVVTLLRASRFWGYYQLRSRQASSSI